MIDIGEIAPVRNLTYLRRHQGARSIDFESENIEIRKEMSPWADNATQIKADKNKLQDILSFLIEKHKQDKNLPKECPICLENFDIIKDILVKVPSNGWVFHDSCLKGYVSQAIRDKNFPIHYPMEEVKRVIPLEVLKKLLTREKMQDYEQQKLFIEALQNPHLYTFCPTPDCQHVFNIADGNNNEICPLCKQSICLVCKTPSHELITCQEYQLSQQVGEGVQDFLKNTNCKKCMRCNYWIEKTEGCNHMTCKCKNEFCFVCGAKWKTCPCETQNEEELRRIEEQERRWEEEMMRREIEEEERRLQEEEERMRQEEEEELRIIQEEENERRRPEEEERRLQEEEAERMRQKEEEEEAERIRQEEEEELRRAEEEERRRVEQEERWMQEKEEEERRRQEKEEQMRQQEEERLAKEAERIQQLELARKKEEEEMKQLMEEGERIRQSKDTILRQAVEELERIRKEKEEERIKQFELEYPNDFEEDS